VALPVDKIITRMMNATGCKTQAELAKILGYKPSAITDAKRRKSIPKAWYFKLIKSHNLNPDWLEKGEGQKFLGEQPEHSGRTEPRSKSETAADAVEYDEDDQEELTLDEFWQTFFNVVADPAWRGWYRIELTKRFPELTERIKKQREVDRKDELARTKVVGE
jgi:hypothetical protein